MHKKFLNLVTGMRIVSFAGVFLFINETINSKNLLLSAYIQSKPAFTGDIIDYNVVVENGLNQEQSFKPSIKKPRELVCETFLSETLLAYL